MPSSAGVVPLDEQLKDAFSIISLLLAIVAGYLAAIWPSVTELLGKSKPSAKDDADELAARVRGYEVAAWVLAASTALVAAVLAPLVVQVVSSMTWGGTYSAVRAASLLFSAFLLAIIASAMGLALRLRELRRKLRK